MDQKLQHQQNNCFIIGYQLPYPLIGSLVALEMFVCLPYFFMAGRIEHEDKLHKSRFSFDGRRLTIRMCFAACC